LYAHHHCHVSRVALNGHQRRHGPIYCSYRDFICGIVQGSGIGPVTFIIFVNELIELLDCFNVKVKLFADDVKLYVRVSDYNDL